MLGATSVNGARIAKPVRTRRRRQQYRHRRRRISAVGAVRLRTHLVGKKQHRRQLRDQIPVDVEACYDTCRERGLHLDLEVVSIGTESVYQDNRFSVLESHSTSSPEASYTPIRSDFTFSATNPCFSTARDLVENPSPERCRFYLGSLLQRSSSLQSRRSWRGSSARTPHTEDRIFQPTGSINADLITRRFSTMSEGLLLPSIPTTPPASARVKLPGSYLNEVKTPLQAADYPNDPFFDASPIPDEYNIPSPLLYHGGYSLSEGSTVFESGTGIFGSFPFTCGQEAPNPDFESYKVAGHGDTGRASDHFNAAALPSFEPRQNETSDIAPYNPSQPADNTSASQGVQTTVNAARASSTSSKDSTFFSDLFIDGLSPLIKTNSAPTHLDFLAPTISGDLVAPARFPSRIPLKSPQRSDLGLAISTSTGSTCRSSLKSALGPMKTLSPWTSPVSVTTTSALPAAGVHTDRICSPCCHPCQDLLKSQVDRGTIATSTMAAETSAASDGFSLPSFTPIKTALVYDKITSNWTPRWKYFVNDDLKTPGPTYMYPTPQVAICRFFAPQHPTDRQWASADAMAAQASFPPVSPLDRSTLARDLALPAGVCDRPAQQEIMTGDHGADVGSETPLLLGRDKLFAEGEEAESSSSDKTDMIELSNDVDGVPKSSCVIGGTSDDSNDGSYHESSEDEEYESSVGDWQGGEPEYWV